MVGPAQSMRREAFLRWDVSVLRYPSTANPLRSGQIIMTAFFNTNFQSDTNLVTMPINGTTINEYSCGQSSIGSPSKHPKINLAPLRLEIVESSKGQAYRDGGRVGSEASTTRVTSLPTTPPWSPTPAGSGRTSFGLLRRLSKPYEQQFFDNRRGSIDKLTKTQQRKEKLGESKAVPQQDSVILPQMQSSNK